MRRDAIVAGLVLVGTLGAFALVERSDAPITLAVLSVEDMLALPADPGAWMVTIGVSNRASIGLDFLTKKTRASARLGALWVELERPEFVPGLRRNERGGFTMLVPPHTEVCRFQLEYRPESIGDEAEAFFRHGWPSHWFPEVCDWAADHTPKPHRRMLAEVSLPDGPTYKCPKLAEEHNPVAAVDAPVTVLGNHDGSSAAHH